MARLTPEQVLALAESLALPIAADDLAEVTHRLNAFLDVLGPLRELDLERVEPWPAMPDAGPDERPR